MNSAASRFFHAGLFFVLILSPIFFGSVHAWASMPLSVVLFLMLFSFPESVLSIRRIPVYFRIVSGAVFLYVILQIFTISVSPWETSAEFIKWAACGVLFLFVQRLSEPSIEILLKVFMLLAFTEAIYGLIQTRLGFPWILWRPQETFTGYATGTFLNRNQLAGFLELGMGVMMGYLAQSFRRGRKLEFCSIFLVFLTSSAALVQSGSRMGCFSFFAAALGFNLLLFLKNQKASFLIFPVMIAGAGALAFFLGQNEFASRFADLHESWGGRPAAWHDTLVLIRNHFWSGTGLGTFAWSFPQYQSPSLLMSWTHAHHDYLELAATLGVPFFLFWAGGILFLFFQIMRRIWRETSELFFPLWGAGCGLVSFLLHGFTDFNWSVTAHTFWFFALFSVLHTRANPLPTTFDLKPVIRFSIRVACTLLILLSAQKAWAGVYSYQAMRALDEMKYERAALKAGQSLRIDSLNSGTRFILGKSLYENGRRKKDELSISAAGEQFLHLTQERPKFGRAWIYLGLCSEDLQSMKRAFGRGLKLEPGSAWNLYASSSKFLSVPESLNKEEKEQALRSLAFSLKLHYKGQASPYLESALGILWHRFHDFNLLERVTPRDYLSYRILLNFAEKKKLWPYLDRVANEFSKFSAAEYEKQCREADRLLSAGKAGESFELFQKSYWLRQELIEAKIGMLISGSGFIPPLYDLTDARNWLTEILESEEILKVERFGSCVDRAGDDYVKGLFHYKTGKYTEAIRSFEASSEGLAKTRRLRAESYEKIGQREKAVEILMPVLSEENPDLRDLFILKTLDPENKRKIEEKIREIQSKYASYAFAPLKENKSSLWVNLPPGKFQLKLALKSSLGKNVFPYARLRLWEGGSSQIIGNVYVPDTSWKLYRFDFETSGGGRLLTIEQVNPGPHLEIGALKLTAAK